MAFWNGEKLQSELPELVKPFREAAIDCAAYTLTIGREVYVTPSAEAVDAKQQTVKPLGDGEGFTIPPGQFAFLLTEESVKVPNTALAFISMKARIKFRGLVNVSGFHVDPGFSGKLIFAVYNASPVVIHLRQGEDCFLIWYANLEMPTELARKASDQKKIPSDLLTRISGELQSFEGLASKIKSVEKELDGRLHSTEKTLTDRVTASEQSLTNRIHATERTLTDRVNVVINKQNYYQILIAVILLLFGGLLGAVLKDCVPKIAGSGRDVSSNTAGAAATAASSTVSTPSTANVPLATVSTTPLSPSPTAPNTSVKPKVVAAPPSAP